jgi:hypothetical protein
VRPTSTRIEPRFEGSTRAVLAAPEVGPVIRDAVVAALAAADPAQVAALWTRARRRMG